MGANITCEQFERRVRGFKDGLDAMKAQIEEDTEAGNVDAADECVRAYKGALEGLRKYYEEYANG